MLFLAVTRDKMETTLAAWERGTGTKISKDYMGTVIASDGPNDKANINSMGRVIHKLLGCFFGEMVTVCVHGCILGNLR